MKIPRHLFRTAAALSIGGLLAGCSNFLDSEKAVADPNLPTAAARDPLFIGAEANIFGQQEGGLAMIACQWMQQCAGVNGRFVEQQDSYSVNAGTFDQQFQEVYSAGGLPSLRAVQASAAADGDKTYQGIAQVLEALLIGTTTSIWGNIPYSEALTSSTPKFDGQLAIYGALQTLLSSGITNIQAGGPSAVDRWDLFHGGAKTPWIEAAHTLKARYYLHTAEVAGAPAYTSARAEALLGISSPANDLVTAHSAATSERNVWYQFQQTSFGPDLVAGKRLVDLMNAQNDERRPEYFALDLNGAYGGFDVTTGTTGGKDISALGGTRISPTFSQPIVTWDENQLILAETNFKLAATPAAGTIAAQPYLNAVKSAHNKSTVPATLQAIMEEKYISLFQNIEVWNDWKRTCLPALTPAAGRTIIPGRLYYGQTEEQTNPNTPPSTAQNLFTVRNPNDPNPCP